MVWRPPMSQLSVLARAAGIAGMLWASATWAEFFKVGIRVDAGPCIAALAASPYQSSSRLIKPATLRFGSAVERDSSSHESAAFVRQSLRNPVVSG